MNTYQYVLEMPKSHNNSGHQEELTQNTGRRQDKHYTNHYLFILLQTFAKVPLKANMHL